MGQRAIGFIFAGRERFLDISARYILRDAEQFKKVVLCVHTTHEPDLRYIDRLCAAHPNLFVKLDTGVKPTHDTWYFHTFYKHFTSPGEIYLKIDDDIVFIEQLAIRRLIDFASSTDRYYLMFANTVNNGICCHLHQRLGALTAPGMFEWNAHNLSRMANERDDESALAVHRSFFRQYDQQDLARYYFDRWELWEKNIRYSINMFAVRGEDLTRTSESIDRCHNDEIHMTERVPKEVGKMNVIVGQALVSHYGFRVHQHTMDSDPSIYDRYAEICERETCLKAAV